MEPGPDVARRRSSWWQSPLALLAAALLVIGLVAALVFWWLGRDGGDEYWTEIDSRQPITANQEAMVKRLDSHPEPWQATSVTGAKAEGVDWSDEVAIDLVDSSRGRAVISNMSDPASVEKNGRLLILGPAYRPLVERILLDDPTVFTDEGAEDARQTYRLGGWLAYYSPAGSVHDRSDEVEAYLQEVARCPYDADPCPGGDS